MGPDSPRIRFSRTKEGTARAVASDPSFSTESRVIAWQVIRDALTIANMEASANDPNYLPPIEQFVDPVEAYRVFRDQRQMDLAFLAGPLAFGGGGREGTGGGGGGGRASGRGGAGDVADDFVVVRGGTKGLPPPGETFSGAAARTLNEAASGVPHGQIRATTARQIRAAGGTVTYAPELTRSGVINPLHVNVCLGRGPCPFGPLWPNPVPKSGRFR